jgi:hypothetical protein
MYGLIFSLLAFVLVAPAYAQVHVDIGIHFPAPPPLVVVPQIPTVRYVPVPAVPSNLFFYNGQYWVFAAGSWYVSAGYNGPWLVVGPQFVPRPILLVPVQYYHIPPGHWKQWARRSPPHWQEDWGREWADKRGWTYNGGQGDGGKGPGKGHGKGP